MRTCVNCKYFIKLEGQNDMDLTEVTRGTCHRFPPTPMVHPTEKDLKLDMYPSVASFDWCGEFMKPLGVID